MPSSSTPPQSLDTMTSNLSNSTGQKLDFPIHRLHLCLIFPIFPLCINLKTRVVVHIMAFCLGSSACYNRTDALADITNEHDSASQALELHSPKPLKTRICRYFSKSGKFSFCFIQSSIDSEYFHWIAGNRGEKRIGGYCLAYGVMQSCMMLQSWWRSRDSPIIGNERGMLT